MGELEEKLKAVFQDNMLDGDKVEDCGKAMISAEEVFRHIKEEIVPTIRELVMGLEKYDMSCATCPIAANSGDCPKDSNGNLLCPKAILVSDLEKATK